MSRDTLDESEMVKKKNIKIKYNEFKLGFSWHHKKNIVRISYFFLPYPKLLAL